MVVVFQDGGTVDNIQQTVGSTAAFTTADGTELWEWGYLGGPGTPTAPELWNSNSDTADISTAFSVGTANFFANLNVTEQGAGQVLVPQPVTGGFVDVLLRNGSVGSAAPGAFPPFPTSSDVDILVTPVIPEPGSVLVWALLGAVALLGTRRRSIA
jgi:MYXO-CTERM domain-containing protein